MPGLDPQNFQPVATRYTDYAILAHEDIPVPYILRLSRYKINPNIQAYRKFSVLSQYYLEMTTNYRE